MFTKVLNQWCIAVALIIAALMTLNYGLGLPTSSSTRLPFETLSKFQNDQLILFFGFPHCGDACPTSMKKLSTIRGQHGVVFVDIQPFADTQVANNYAQQFDPSFNAWAPTSSERKILVGLFPHEFPEGPFMESHQGRFYMIKNTPEGWILMSSLPTTTAVGVIANVI